MSEEQAKQDNAAAPSEGGSLIDQLLETTKVRPGDESYAITKQGIQTFISSLLDPSRTTDRITASLADDMIAELDKKLCAQVDEILHHADF